MSCGVGHRHGSNLALLWLWHRPAAAAPIRPLAWELPHATSIAIKRKKRKEKKRKITDSLSNDKGRNGYDNYCERQNNGSSKITISQFLEPVNILY